MIVLDASVMVAALDRRDAHSETALRMLDEAADERVVAHRLTLAEALVQAARAGHTSAVAGALDAFGIGRLDEPDDPIRLAEIRAGTG